MVNQPRLVSVMAFDGRDDRALLALVASLVGGLEPPVRSAILESAREREIAIGEVQPVPGTVGQCVAGCVAGHTVVVGNAALFAHLGISTSQLGEWPARLRKQGQYVLFVAIDGRTAGFVGVAGIAE